MTPYIGTDVFGDAGLVETGLAVPDDESCGGAVDLGSV